MTMRRRTFLTAGAAAGVGAALDRALGGAEATAAPPPDATAAALAEVHPFVGRTQQGVTTPQQRFAVFAAFDAVAADRGALGDALQAISDRARRLTAGDRALLGNPGEGPTPDSGLLGVRMAPDGLTVTVGLGSSLFDDRYGLADRRPRGLKAMSTFPDDDLDATQCHGDVLLQLCAHSQETLVNALRDLMRATRGALAIRWKVEGFKSGARERGASRNLLGFKDGTSNPETTDSQAMDRLVWTPEGGTNVVVRTIRNRVEFWDRVALNEQELMIGRRKDTGAPLDGRSERDAPRFAADPHGERIPLDSHIRLANPRGPAAEGARILRRGYNYSRGIDTAGQLDMGLLFASYQRDLRQFEAIQRRLAGEPLVDYVVPTGGGYFHLPPGAADGRDFVGSGLVV